ncbi:hypothetical protein BJY52DRAFT_1426644 [Lactarius psammicola]|nr:hypothetical protein BJY52DRAFT_1426644 [Lactarius psammicola]
MYEIRKIDAGLPKTLTSKVIVYASSLPLKVVHDANLDLCPSNWGWVHCLTFPLATLDALHFSHRPYKWVRYAIGVVIGAQGHLSISPIHPMIFDEEKQRTFPIDPHFFRTQDTTSTSSDRRGTFREQVAARDGQRCVWTGWGLSFCDAVHLIAHSKNIEYISTLTRRRGRDDNGDDIVTDIDSVRNGIFLNKMAHGLLGTQLAFLQLNPKQGAPCLRTQDSGLPNFDIGTPNFAMDTTDVDHKALPEHRGCTAHIIQLDTRLPVEFVSGSPLRISASHRFRPPPDVLFDAVYAGFVLHHFGTKGMKDGAIIDEHSTATRAKARDERRAKRRGPDNMNMLMAIPYLLVPSNELQAQMRAGGEQAEAAEQRRVQEKVKGWIEQVDTG